MFVQTYKLHAGREGGGTNLGSDVVKGGRADNGEADEEDVGLRVREGDGGGRSLPALRYPTDLD